MEEEMSQIEKNKTWELLPRPKDKNIIGTKLVFKNIMNEEGRLLETRQGLSANAIHKLKELNLKRNLHQ